MDLRNILSKLDQLNEGSMSSAKKKSTGPNFVGKMKGTDPASAAKDKYVGGSMEESIFKELEATLRKDPVKRDLSKEFRAFKEAYDHNAPFNAADFNRHMEQLRAREELRKTDPMRALVGDLIDKEHEKERLAKRKPADDDSMSTSDPRHPQYAYTQAGQHNVDEGSELPVQQHKSPYEGSDDELRYTTMFLASPNSAQRFAKHIISKGGKARIGKRGQDYYVYHNMPMSKEDWRKSEQQGLEESPEEALKYATQAHAGQTRSGGDPYISHPVRVANHIKQYKQSHNLDALISAAYLHDTIEDTDTTHEALHDLFGGLVASLVKELTSDPEQIKKMGKAAYLSHKMAAMSSYALVIKLADRLDNVKDITTARTPQWRAKYAAETNQILDYIEKTRALSNTHKKLIELIRAKLAEIDNPQHGVAEGSLNEFAPGNGDDGLPYAEYQVYQCNPLDQFDWIGGPLYQTDNMGMAHKYAYEKYVKHRPKAFMVWQERTQGSRGNYGVKGESDSNEDLKEFAVDKDGEGDGRSKLIGSIAQLLQAKKKVDFYVPGIRGHVAGIGGQGDWVTLKRWNKPYSKVNYSLALDSSDDRRFALKMIRPDYYQVVQAGDLDESWVAAVAEGFSELDLAVMEGGHELVKEAPIAPTAPGAAPAPGTAPAPVAGKPTLGADLNKQQAQQQVQQQANVAKQQADAAKQAKLDQANLQKGVNSLKSAGAAISNPGQTAQAFNKVDANAALTPGDKTNIASAGTVLAPIMANQQLAGKFKDLVNQASAEQKKEQQAQQAQQAQQPAQQTQTQPQAPVGVTK